MKVKLAGMLKGTVTNERGFAVLITVMVVSLLVVVTLQFNDMTRRGLVASTNVKDRFELGAIAQSGLNIAEAVLARDGDENDSDTLFDSWAQLAGEDFPSLFHRGSLKLAVVDLSGKFQINSVVGQSSNEQGREQSATDRPKELLKRLLLSAEFGIEDESRATEIIHAIVDWIDTDERESDFGAESSYYLSLENPYQCKNRPVEFIEELLLVKGVTRGLLFGTDGKKGLSSYITAHGRDGKININTAPQLLLQMLDSQMTRELAEKMMEFRDVEENRERLAQKNWYEDVSSWPGDIVLDETMISTVSSYFRIEATGKMGTLTKLTTGIVRRLGKGSERIIRLTRKVE